MKHTRVAFIKVFSDYPTSLWPDSQFPPFLCFHQTETPLIIFCLIFMISCRYKQGKNYLLFIISITEILWLLISIGSLTHFACPHLDSSPSLCLVCLYISAFSPVLPNPIYRLLLHGDRVISPIGRISKSLERSSWIADFGDQHIFYVVCN